MMSSVERKQFLKSDKTSLKLVQEEELYMRKGVLCFQMQKWFKILHIHFSNRRAAKFNCDQQMADFRQMCISFIQNNINTKCNITPGIIFTVYFGLASSNLDQRPKYLAVSSRSSFRIYNRPHRRYCSYIKTARVSAVGMVSGYGLDNGGPVFRFSAQT